MITSFSAISNLSAPMSVDINLTNRCNLFCGFCSASPFHHSTRTDELTTAELSSIFDQIDDMGVFLVRLAGGEPLARADIVEIIELTKGRIFETLILSNGLLLNERIVEALVAAGMDTIALSVDGHTADIHDTARGKVGALKGLVAKLPLLRANGVRFVAMCTVTRQNCCYLVEISQFLQDLGFASVRFILLNFSGLAKDKEQFPSWSTWSSELLRLTDFVASKECRIDVSILPPHEDPVPYEVYVPLKDAGRLTDAGTIWGIEVELLSRKVESIGCAAGRTQMTIFENGDVFGCELMRDFSPLLAGNTREQKLSSIWNDSLTFHKLRQMRKNDLVGSCSECPLHCGGGCRASAANLTGSINGSDENCHVSR